MGARHQATLGGRAGLAAAYAANGQFKPAIEQHERVLADSERMLGAGDTETLTTRCSLASAYYTAGRLSEVVAVLQRP